MKFNATSRCLHLLKPRLLANAEVFEDEVALRVQVLKLADCARVVTFGICGLELCTSNGFGLGDLGLGQLCDQGIDVFDKCLVVSLRLVLGRDRLFLERLAYPGIDYLSWISTPALRQRLKI